MSDSSITKVSAQHSPKGEMGQRYLASGKAISMRLWDEKAGAPGEKNIARDYEAVGYVLEGSAELDLEGQTVRLEAGDSWVVPKGAHHTYRIKGHFKAVEATAPPAQVHNRDAPKA